MIEFPSWKRVYREGALREGHVARGGPARAQVVAAPVSSASMMDSTCYHWRSLSPEGIEDAFVKRPASTRHVSSSRQTASSTKGVLAEK